MSKKFHIIKEGRRENRLKMAVRGVGNSRFSHLFVGPDFDKNSFFGVEYYQEKLR